MSGRLKESGEEIRKWNERTGELDKRVGWGEREGRVHKCVYKKSAEKSG